MAIVHNIASTAHAGPRVNTGGLPITHADLHVEVLSEDVCNYACGPRSVNSIVETPTGDVLISYLAGYTDSSGTVVILCRSAGSDEFEIVMSTNDFYHATGPAVLRNGPDGTVYAGISNFNVADPTDNSQNVFILRHEFGYVHPGTPDFSQSGLKTGNKSDMELIRSKGILAYAEDDAPIQLYSLDPMSKIGEIGYYHQNGNKAKLEYVYLSWDEENDRLVSVWQTQRHAHPPIRYRNAMCASMDVDSGNVYLCDGTDVTSQTPAAADESGPFDELTAVSERARSIEVNSSAVIGSVLYVSYVYFAKNHDDWYSVIVAKSLETGEELWRVHPDRDEFVPQRVALVQYGCAKSNLAVVGVRADSRLVVRKISKDTGHIGVKLGLTVDPLPDTPGYMCYSKVTGSEDNIMIAINGASAPDGNKLIFVSGRLAK